MQSVIRVIDARFRNEIEVRSDSQYGMYGIHEGQLPHVGDAMNLFNEAWGMTRRSTVTKCWVKSMCLPENLRIEARELLESILPSESLIDLTSPDRLNVSCESVVSNKTSANILNDMHVIVAYESSKLNTLVQQILQEAQELVQVSDFITTRNSPASFDADPSRNELAETFLQSMFDENWKPSALVEEVRSQQCTVSLTFKGFFIGFVCQNKDLI